MNKKILNLVVALFGFSMMSYAQPDPALITIDGETVSKSEFERVYKKNNTKDVSFDNKAVREYLDLYINYKLKVKAAEELHMDTSSAFMNELNGYKKQLAQPYLTDKEVSEGLIKEAYDRMQKDVRASHILVKCAADALPKDTVAAYNKAMKIREKIMKGADFATMARDSSEDPSAKENGGDLGYFTAMQMVYPFESAAYTTPIGKLSMPVRTRFGYHILKTVDMRPAQGEIHCAHIMVKCADNETSDSVKTAAKAKIEEIAAKLKQGEKFEDLATQFSDDKGSAKNGGVLPWFGTGRMVPEFERTAFALKGDNEVSEPIKSSYGWHIIKRLEKRGLPTYDEKKGELKQQIQKDSRSELSKTSMLNKIKAEYKFSENAANRDAFLATLDSSIIKGEYAPDEKAPLTKPIMTLGENTYSQRDFANYLALHQVRRPSGEPMSVGYSMYQGFVDEACISYEEARLEKKYPEFKNLMQEYRDGILLFDLTDKLVWSKAVKDTTGLKEYYEKNKNNYMWAERINAKIYQCATPEIAASVRKMLKKKKDDAEMLQEVNKDSQLNLTIKEGKYSKGDNEIIDGITWTKGISADMQKNNQTVFVDVKEVLTPMPKALDEAKGIITADYQNHLEKNWIEELRKKHPVNVDEAVLRTIIKE
ncbi:MAG: peptidylprolyl isomerase [Bacteroidetes bacterium]|nr:peptidylprolyl isomerase [Bacteroidota bacterium]